MIKIKFKELNFEKFNKYGAYADMLNPSGVKFGNEDTSFYRDLIQGTLGQSNIASYSLAQIKKIESTIIDWSEYHNYCSETIIPLDGDILISVGPAGSNDIVPVEEIELFRIPKGTLVKLNPGVWHFRPFTYKYDSVNILFILPERTYMNDCHVVKIPEEKRIELDL